MATNRVTSLRARLILAFAIVYIVWGSTYIAIDIAVDVIPPFQQGGMRFLLSGILLVGYARIRGTKIPDWPAWRDAGVSGVLMLAGGNGLLSLVETKMPSGVASLLVATVPLWMVVINAFEQRRRPTIQVMVGLLLGAIGVAVLVGADAGWEGGEVDLLFVGLMLFGAFCWATGSMFSRHAVGPGSLWMRTGMQMLIGGAVMAAVGAISDPLPLSQWTPASSWAFVYLVFAGGVVAYSSYIWLMRNASPAAVSTYAFVNPLVAVSLGAWLLAEPITPRTLVATALIVASVMTIVLRRRRPQLPATPDPAPPASD